MGYIKTLKKKQKKLIFENFVKKIKIKNTIPKKGLVVCCTSPKMCLDLEIFISTSQFSSELKVL